MRRSWATMLVGLAFATASATTIALLDGGDDPAAVSPDAAGIGGPGGSSPTATSPVTESPSATGAPAPTAVGSLPGPTASTSPVTGPYPSAESTGPDRDCSALERRGDMTLGTAGAVLENVDVHGTVTVRANNVTIRNSCIRPDTSRDFGVVIPEAHGTVIDHVLIAGNGTVHQGVQAFDDAGVVVRYTEISGTDDAVSTGVGLIEESYLHGPRTGGHADMVEATGWRSSWDQPSSGTTGCPTRSTCVGLTVRHNTIINHLSQTSAIALFQDTGERFHNALIEDNYLSGGAYTLYGGGGSAGDGVNIVIRDNTFHCGSAGCVTAFSTDGAGNLWTGNVRDNDSRTPVVP